MTSYNKYHWHQAHWHFYLGILFSTEVSFSLIGTQGLAPHYDDVELWVCQTEGSKRWRVYKSIEGYELPFASSKDFDESEIGEPVIDTVLQVILCSSVTSLNANESSIIQSIEILGNWSISLLSLHGAVDQDREQQHK